MSETMNQQAWLTGKSDNRRFALAFGIGLLLEAGVLAILLPVMTHQRPPPSDTQNTIKISVLAPSPPAPPAPPPPKPKQIVPPPKPVAPPPPLPTPPPLPMAPPMAPPPPMPVAPNRPVIHHPPRPRPRHVTPPPIQPPPVVQTPPTPTPPPPPAAPAAPSAGELALFQAEMRRAVQAAAVNPAAAQMAHEAGVVRVEFTYLNGAASDIEVIGSSGFSLLDDAARDAVRNAAYPPQPPDMAGQPDDIVVDVIFRPAATNIDGD
jgi:protein TonB